MDLAELQLKLRSIENQMASLQDEIERMKPQTEDMKKEIYRKINFWVKQFPSEKRVSFSNIGELKKDYIACLAYITLMKEDNIYENLLYLCRLAHSIGLNAECEKIIKLGMEINKETFYRLCLELKDYKYPLLVDCLIIANLAGGKAETIISTIADLATMLEVDKEKLRALGVIAKSVLINNPETLRDIPAQSANWWGEKLKGFIPSDWIVKQRCYCGTVSVSKRIYYGRKYNEDRFIEEIKTSKITNVEAGKVVKANETICNYKGKKEKMTAYVGPFSFLDVFANQANTMTNTVESKESKGEEFIKAPCNGMVFFAEHHKYGKVKGYEKNYKETLRDIYVVSYFDNYKDFSNWYDKVELPKRIEDK